MGERRPCKAEVVGSIPISSTGPVCRMRGADRTRWAPRIQAIVLGSSFDL